MRSPGYLRPMALCARSWTLLRRNPILVMPVLVAYALVILVSLPTLLVPAWNAPKADTRTLVVVLIVSYAIEWVFFSAAVAMTYGMAAEVWRFGSTTLAAGWAAMRRTWTGVALFFLAVGILLGGAYAPLLIWSQTHPQSEQLPPQLGWLTLVAVVLEVAVGFFGAYALPGIVTGEQGAWRAFAASAGLAVRNAALTVWTLFALLTITLSVALAVGIVGGAAGAVGAAIGKGAAGISGGVFALLFALSALALQALAHVAFTGLYLALVGGEGEPGEDLRPRYE